MQILLYLDEHIINSNKIVLNRWYDHILSF